MKIPAGILRSFFEAEFNVKETSDSDEIRINNFATNNKKYKTYISLSKNCFIDFKNDIAPGSIKRFIAEYLNINENEVLPYLLENYGVGLPKEIKEEIIQNEYKEEDEIDKIQKEITFFKKGVGFFGRKALRYLLNRKIPLEYIKKIGYVYDVTSEYNERIIIPFYEDGKMVYFTARSLNKEDVLRYKNPKIDSKQYLFNYDKLNEDLPVVLVEGVFDAMSVTNFPAVPLMSAHISKTQIMKLVEKGIKEIIIIPDGDETGQATLKRNVELIKFNYPSSISLKIYVYNLPEGFKDMNEYLCSTGSGEIAFSHCELYNRNKIFFKNFEFKSCFSM